MPPGTLVDLLRSRTVSNLPRRLPITWTVGTPTAPHRAALGRGRPPRPRRRRPAPGARTPRRAILLLFPPGLDFIAAFFGASTPEVSPCRHIRRIRGASTPRAPPPVIVRDARPAAVLTTELVRQLSAHLAAGRPSSRPRDPGRRRPPSDAGPEPGGIRRRRTISRSSSTPPARPAPRGRLRHPPPILANQEMISAAFAIPRRLLRLLAAALPRHGAHRRRPPAALRGRARAS